MTCESKIRSGDFSVLECLAPAVWMARSRDRSNWSVCDECRKKLVTAYGDRYATFSRI